MGKVMIRKRNQTVCIMVGSLISVLLCLGSIALLAYLVVGGTIGESAGRAILMVIASLAVFVGSEVAFTISGRKPLYTPIVVAVVQLLFMLLLGMLTVEGKLVFRWGSVGTIGVGCVISLLKVMMNKGNKHTRKIRSR